MGGREGGARGKSKVARTSGLSGKSEVNRVPTPTLDVNGTQGKFPKRREKTDRGNPSRKLGLGLKLGVGGGRGRMKNQEIQDRMATEVETNREGNLLNQVGKGKENE